MTDVLNDPFAELLPLRFGPVRPMALGARFERSELRDRLNGNRPPYEPGERFGGDDEERGTEVETDSRLAEGPNSRPNGRIEVEG